MRLIPVAIIAVILALCLAAPAWAGPSYIPGKPGRVILPPPPEPQGPGRAYTTPPPARVYCRPGTVWSARQRRCIPGGVMSQSCQEGQHWSTSQGRCVNNCPPDQVWSRNQKTCIKVDKP